MSAPHQAEVVMIRHKCGHNERHSRSVLKTWMSSQSAAETLARQQQYWESQKCIHCTQGP